MSSISSIRAKVPKSTGAMYADASGSVLESEGGIDSETISATVALSLPTLEEAGDLLGLGNLEGWSIVASAGALYVHRHADGFVAVAGPPTKNPEAILKKLSE